VTRMRLALFLALAAMTATTAGCEASDTAQLEEDMEQLGQRVQMLEQKVRRLEGGSSKATKGKAPKGKAPKGKAAKGKTPKGKPNAKGKAPPKGKAAKGKAPKGKGAPAPGSPEALAKMNTAPIAPGKGALSLSGDAIKVMVDNGQRKFVVPNTRLAAGEYTLMAAFKGEKKLTAYGKVNVVVGERVALECTAQPKGCKVTP